MHLADVGHFQLRGRVLFAALGAVTALATSARASPPDTSPPVITCQPPGQVTAGPVEISFTVTDQSALFGVLLHWRPVGETNYREIDFPQPGPHFTAKLTASSDFEFWIEAYDVLGNGPALFASADHPQKVTVTTAAAVPPPASATVPPAGNQERFHTVLAVPPPNAAPPPPPPASPPPNQENLVNGAPTGPMAPLRATRVLRAFTGRALPVGMFQIRANGDYAFGGDFLYPGASLSGESMGLSVAYQALSFLGVGLDTAFGHSSLAAGSAATSAWPLSASTGTDFDLTLRLTSGPLGVVHLGLVGNLALPAAASNGSRVANPGLTGAVTVDAPGAVFTLNAGYLWNNSESTVGGAWSDFDTYALDLSRYDDLGLALAAQVPLGQVTPFVEWSLDVPVDRLKFASCSGQTSTATCAPSPSLFPASGWQIPQRLGLGARYDFTSLIGLELGLDFSLTGAGSGYSSSTNESRMLLPGLAPPPPFDVQLRFVYQLGAAAAAAPTAAPKPAGSAHRLGEDEPF